MGNELNRLGGALDLAMKKSREKEVAIKEPELPLANPYWNFREMLPGEENHNPIHGEFFSTDALGDLNDVLVREACQNSIDAKVDASEKVKVYFHFRNIPKDDPRHKSVLSNNLNKLWPHLQAEGNGLIKIPDQSQEFPYLCIEDFNTFGLEGSPGYDDIDAPIDKNSRNHFFFFWRNIARSGKQSDRLGSWGVGKQVFPAASLINSYFAVSCRESDGQKSLMGKSVLKIHHCPRKCNPFGYWGVFGSGNDMAMPVTDADYISNFSNDLGLRRKDESGLSVIIPYVKTELWGDPKQLAVAAIKHYLYPVLADKLEIYAGKGINSDHEVEDDWYKISKNTISQQAADLIPDDIGIHDLLDLITWGSNLASEEMEKLISNPGASKASDWNDVAINDEILNKLQEEFNVKGKIAVAIPVKIKKSGEKIPDLTHFKLFIGQTQSARKIQAKFIRQGIDVANVNKNRPLAKGYVALLMVDDPILSQLLRDSEPPSHDNWETRAGRLENWVSGAKSIRFIVNSISQIIQLLEGDSTEADPDLLKEIFSVTLDTEQKPGKSPKSGPKEEEPQEEGIEEIEKPPRYTPEAIKIKDQGVAGFKIYPPPNATLIPDTVTIECAYMTSSGNPLKNYSELDFCMDKDPIAVEGAGVSVVEMEKNRMVLKIDDSDYRVKVTGFDVNRDLYLRVNAEKPGEDEEPEE